MAVTYYRIHLYLKLIDLNQSTISAKMSNINWFQLLECQDLRPLFSSLAVNEESEFLNCWLE